MKVILKGILGISNEGIDETYTYYADLLKQVPYPIEIETVEAGGFVCFKDYIKDPDSPNSEEEWCLDWFDYEEIED